MDIWRVGSATCTYLYRYFQAGAHRSVAGNDPGKLARMNSTSGGFHRFNDLEIGRLQIVAPPVVTGQYIYRSTTDTPTLLCYSFAPCSFAFVTPLAGRYRIISGALFASHHAIGKQTQSALSVSSRVGTRTRSIGCYHALTSSLARVARLGIHNIAFLSSACFQGANLLSTMY